MMATYFHGGSEIQATGDNLQTLYLLNPNYIAAYSEGQTSHNMLLLNPGVPPNGLSIPHAPPAPPPPANQQQFIGIPLTGTHHVDDPSRPSSSSSSLHHHHSHQIPAASAPPLHGLAVSRVNYNLWSPTADPSPNPDGPGGMGQMGFRRPVAAQGLSLSLSPGQQQQQQQNPATTTTTTAVVGGSGPIQQGVIMGSKYLKAAQELLDEVVNVNDVDQSIYRSSSGGGGSSNGENGARKEKAKGAGAGECSSNGGSSSKMAADQLTTAQRQELQMKKAKLLNMLDEVEQRYRQYHSQMEIVVSSLEQAAGRGSAKLYTSLALKTISKQFRCLKDAITSQIKATSKSLGEEGDNHGGGTGGGKLEGSRLRFVDQQLRQQRALQQLGMMQPNAWRPQRGLPERAVSVLRAWLFEHFLHPYPKDSDKHMLAKQTGLTRSQVSNWFINARVRLWKPMVEEMYTEEMKAQNHHNGGTSEDNNNNSSNTPSKNEHQLAKNDQSSTKPTTMTGQQHEQQLVQSQDHQTANDMISNLSAMSMESLMARSPKKQRSSSDMQNSPSSILSMDMEMKPLEDHHQRQHSLISNHGDAGAGSFNPYIVNDIGRFNPDQLTPHHYNNHGNAVSLTLGLPHCENLSLSAGSHHQQNFISNQGMQLARRLDIGPGEPDFCGISMAQPSHPSNGYQGIDIQSRKRFAAHLLHDFVA